MNRDSEKRAEIEARQAVERRLVGMVVDAALNAGYLLNLNNGGDGLELKEHTADAGVILQEMFATQDEHLILIKDGKRVAYVYFVYGNDDGWTVISDYSTNLEELLKPIDDLVMASM